MREREFTDPTRVERFFRLIVGDESALVYYKLNHEMVHKHCYRWDELENMMPFEREVIIAMIHAHLEEKRLQRESARKG